MPTRSSPDTERDLAVFIDLENLAVGAEHTKRPFDIDKVLERLLEKGKLIVKKAYADWNRFPLYTQSFHESAIELIEIPRRVMTGKNSADIRLVVDAMDLAWSKPHIDTFVIVSGDSDFSPLVSKLKENGKHVIGLGMRGSTSELLRDNCDEFIYYEDLERQAAAAPAQTLAPDLPEKKREVFALLLSVCEALRRENQETIYASQIKDTMKRKNPSFSEGYYGFRSFTELLEDAERNGLLTLQFDQKSGTSVVTRLRGEQEKSAPMAMPMSAAPSPAPKRPSRRRR
jgi:uncharacterized protein (TIGR00288 family)